MIKIEIPVDEYGAQTASTTYIVRSKHIICSVYLVSQILTVQSAEAIFDINYQLINVLFFTRNKGSWMEIIPFHLVHS